MKPILFSGEMVRAILDGRKTQTRRVIKPQPDFVANYYETGKKRTAWSGGSCDPKLLKCPYGQAGDGLWVRETFGVITQPLTGEKSAIYKATHKPEFPNEQLGFDGSKWRPSIFMPRWASRITLRVVDVRVEMLWDMTVSKMIAEGVAEIENNDKHPLTPFITLWDSINADRGYAWYTNPWVWVVEFEEVSWKTAR